MNGDLTGFDVLKYTIKAKGINKFVRTLPPDALEVVLDKGLKADDNKDFRVLLSKGWYLDAEILRRLVMSLVRSARLVANCADSILAGDSA